MLPLKWTPTYTRQRFCVGPSNQDAWQWIERWPWAVSHVWLYGPAGCGKTHMAHIWAQVHHAAWISLGNDGWQDVWEQALREGASAVVMDDLHRVISQHKEKNQEPKDGPSWARLRHRSQQLVTVWNEAQAADMTVLWVSRMGPVGWPAVSEDWTSRMKAMYSVAVHMPDDSVWQQVLVKAFADVGVRLRPGWIRYLIAHLPRHGSAVAYAVHLLERLGPRVPLTMGWVRQAVAEITAALQGDSCGP